MTVLLRYVSTQSIVRGSFQYLHQIFTIYSNYLPSISVTSYQSITLLISIFLQIMRKLLPFSV